ncbi:MAG: sulfur carrier protein ThiS [Phycisphaerae bacterium]|nr:sulfur carrier protein ThiS [Phycisphaerae bacterium]
MKTLKVNGKVKEFNDGFPTTLTELLDKLKVDAATIVAEVDGNIIERKNFDSTALNENQDIELIRFVPGG